MSFWEARKTLTNVTLRPSGLLHDRLQGIWFGVWNISRIQKKKKKRGSSGAPEIVFCATKVAQEGQRGTSHIHSRSQTSITCFQNFLGGGI